jgi:hypothetical protein
MLKRIFEPNKDEVARGWRKLHNEDLHKLYCSPNIIIIRGIIEDGMRHAW